MDLKADLDWIHRELDNVKDPAFIEAIKNLLEYNNKVSSDRISIEQYNQEIEASIAQIESGHTYSHEQMEERINQWGKQ